MNKSLATIGVLCAFLAACGGSDDDNAEPPAPPSSAEGFWLGRTSTGMDVQLAVLENGETWGVYSSRGMVAGALIGNTSTDGTRLSGSGLDFNLSSRNVSKGTYSGSFTPKSNVSIALSNGTSFTGTYSSVYDQPASLAALAGTFSGGGVTGTTAPQTITVTISSSGAVTLPASGGCGASGTTSPRPSGKNVFDLSITFQGSTCALGHGATVRGVAFYDTTTRHLTALAANGAKTDGFIFVGTK